MARETKMTQARLVGWAVGPDGYALQVLDEENQPIVDERFGNNPCSSDVGDTLPLDDPKALGRETLEEYAVRAASELAEEHGLPAEKVFRDVDFETVLQEQYEQAESLRSGPAFG